MFEFIFRYFWDLIGYFLRFLRPSVTGPIDDVLEFIRKYELRYGVEHPTFYQGSYSQALADAKRELKFLLVYLHCDDHVDTEAFCRKVMTFQPFRDIIRENMLFWACSVSTAEGYRTSQALRENTYPFLGLIVLKNNRMTIVSRIEGIIDPEALHARLLQAVADNDGYLVVERQERNERSMTQTLRQQQDEAYMESLKADQEKERKKKAELEKKHQEELEKQRLEDEEKAKRELLKQQKVLAGLDLPPEPAQNDENVIRVVIKLPCGTRLERRFFKSDSMKGLYNFVFSHKDSPDYFEIATNFPKRTLKCKPTEEIPDPQSFQDAGLGKNEMLFVYDLES